MRVCHSMKIQQQMSTAAGDHHIFNCQHEAESELGRVSTIPVVFYLPNAATLFIVPYVVVNCPPPPYNYFCVCNFATGMNCNVNIFEDRGLPEGSRPSGCESTTALIYQCLLALRYTSFRKAVSPNSSQMVPPTEDQVFKYPNLWRIFLIQSPSPIHPLPTPHTNSLLRSLSKFLFCCCDKTL